MADLKIDYAAARSLGDQVMSQSDTFNDYLSQVKNANESLKSYWQGTDSSKYAEEVEKQAQTMDQLYSTMSEIGQYLKRVGDAYEKVNESNQQAMK